MLVNVVVLIQKCCFVYCNLFAGISVVLKLQRHQRIIVSVLVICCVDAFAVFCKLKKYLNSLCNVKKNPFLACPFCSALSFLIEVHDAVGYDG